MFIGRKEELTKLESLYASGKFECAVIYGRRRVGKTTLINEFVRDKRTIYFTGLETSQEENLANLSKSIMELGQVSAKAAFQSFEDALEAVYEYSKKERIVLVIDEFPYLANSYKAISSLLQVMIDQKYLNSQLFIILCGSSMSFMEQQVLGYKSPLYGRRTAQFKLEPFTYFEVKEYFPQMEAEDLAFVYGITGGIPLYLTKINPQVSVEENIKNNFFDANAYLFEEPSNLLKQELREPAQYNAVIKAIAGGASRVSEIASKVKLDTGKCSNYLQFLLSLGIIKKETPFGENTLRKTIYSLADGMFQFWYKFVPDNIALIQKGQKDLVFKLVEPQLPAYMGFIFEAICKQYLWQENIAGRLPFTFQNIGRWWGNDPYKRCESEIDLVAACGSTGLLAECKWTNALVEAKVLEDLLAQQKLLYYDEVYCYLFAKKGFTPECKRQAAALQNVMLVEFASM